MLLMALLLAVLPNPDKASEAVSSMRAGIKPLMRIVEEARDKKDIVRLNCVNEKLGQAKGLLRIGEASLVSLIEALARKDQEVSAHEAQKIDIAAQKSEQVRADARVCVGEFAVYAGDTQVIVKFSGKDQPDPTVMTILDLLAPPLLLRPFQVSPYQ